MEREDAASSAPLLERGASEDGRRRGYVRPERRTGWANVSFILFAELVGTGILALPYTFAKVGYAVGTGLLVLFMAMSVYAGLLLHRLHMMYPEGITYGDLAGAVARRRVLPLAWDVARPPARTRAPPPRPSRGTAVIGAARER